MKRCLLILCLVICVSHIITPIVRAQGLSLDVYPSVIQIQTTPPSSPNVPIILQNNNKESVRLKIKIIPIQQKGIKGEVELKPDLLQTGFYKFYEQSIQIIIDGLKSDIIELKPLEKKEVSLNLNLNENDPSGDYYYSVVFMTEEENAKQSNISNINAGIATNLLLSVGPTGDTTGNINEFSTSFLKFQGPAFFRLKINNSSKHLIQPSGEIIIKNIFGQIVGRVKIPPQYILAESERYLTSDNRKSGKFNKNSSLYSDMAIWEEENIFGLYKAEAQILLSENSKSLSSSLYFFALPIYLLSTIVISLFIIISIYYKLKKKI